MARGRRRIVDTGTDEYAFDAVISYAQESKDAQMQSISMKLNQPSQDASDADEQKVLDILLSLYTKMIQVLRYRRKQSCDAKLLFGNTASCKSPVDVVSRTFGRIRDSKLELSPIEWLFLFERGVVDIDNLSKNRCWVQALESIDLGEYCAYARLRRLGYIVIEDNDQENTQRTKESSQVSKYRVLKPSNNQKCSPWPFSKAFLNYTTVYRHLLDSAPQPFADRDENNILSKPSRFNVYKPNTSAYNKKDPRTPQYMLDVFNSRSQMPALTDISLASDQKQPTKLVGINDCGQMPFLIFSEVETPAIRHKS